MTYEPRPRHFILPAALLVLGTVAAYLPRFGIFLAVGLAALACWSASVIGAAMMWESKADHNRSMAEIGRVSQGMTQNEKEAWGFSCPELRVIFGKAQPSLLVVDNSGVDFRFFVEFMEASNSVQTVAKRELEGNALESRDARRRKWDQLTDWLMDKRYLAAAPKGRDTYQWRPGSYEMLYNGLVAPYADKMLIGPGTNVYQAVAEHVTGKEIG